jgi:site-specific recombinase XerD
MHLKDHPSQSEFAKDIFRIYKFWKHERPARKDPFDSYHLKREGKEWLGSFSEEEGRLLDEANDLEMKYEQEDQEMLHLIVKHRLGLWT